MAAIPVPPIIAADPFFQADPILSPLAATGIPVPSPSPVICAIESITQHIAYSTSEPRKRSASLLLRAEVVAAALPPPPPPPGIQPNIGDRILARLDQMENRLNTRMTALEGRMGDVERLVQPLVFAAAQKTAISDNNHRFEAGMPLVPVPRCEDGGLGPNGLPPLESREQVRNLSRNQLTSWLAYYRLARQRDTEREMTSLLKFLIGRNPYELVEP